jgi:cob(I)alamin adenosyltransferase
MSTNETKETPNAPKLTTRRIKLYTKSGDKGKTSLYDGSRRYKEDYVFDVLGTIDELNCHVAVIAGCHEYCRVIQYKLMNISSVIATPHRNKNLPDVTEEDIKSLETRIDALQAECTPLREFVIPGSTAGDAQVHICRAVTRRAERMVSRLFHNGGQPFTNGERIVPNKDLPKYKKRILIWFNRLSDYFFAMARKEAGASEITMSEMEEKMRKLRAE